MICACTKKRVCQTIPASPAGTAWGGAAAGSGVFAGCSTGVPNDFGRKHKAGRTAERIAVGTAGQLFDAGGQLLCSSCRFAAHSLFKRLGCCFSAVGAVGAVLARHGIWCTGCLLLCRRTAIPQPLLPAGASSTGVGGGAAADLCGRMCAAFFQPLFLCTLSKRSL